MYNTYFKDGYVPYNYWSPETRRQLKVIEIPSEGLIPNRESPEFLNSWGFDHQKYDSRFADNVNKALSKFTEDQYIYCVPTRICIGEDFPVYTIVRNPEGFTQQEYDEVKGIKSYFPKSDGDILTALNDEGKVCFYPPNGDLSVFMGAPEFSRKGKLCTELRKELPLRVKLVN